MASVIMNAKCTADHDSPDSMLPRELCLTCNPRKRKSVPRDERPKTKSDGVTLAPPLAVYKALQADLSNETEKEITSAAETEMAKTIGPKEALLRQQREALVAGKTVKRKDLLTKLVKTTAKAETQPAIVAEKQESDMSATAKKTTKATASKKAAKSTARKTVKSTAARPTKAAKNGSRKTYDWKGAAENAAKGIIPAAPDFSANTHRCYREPLAQAVKLVKAGDLKGLQALKFTRDDGSPGMIKRYRDIAVIALKAKK